MLDIANTLCHINRLFSQPIQNEWVLSCSCFVSSASGSTTSFHIFDFPSFVKHKHIIHRLRNRSDVHWKRLLAPPVPHEFGIYIRFRCQVNINPKIYLYLCVRRRSVLVLDALLDTICVRIKLLFYKAHNIYYWVAGGAWRGRCFQLNIYTRGGENEMEWRENEAVGWFSSSGDTKFRLRRVKFPAWWWKTTETQVQVDLINK